MATALVLPMTLVTTASPEPVGRAHQHHHNLPPVVSTTTISSSSNNNKYHVIVETDARISNNNNINAMVPPRTPLRRSKTAVKGLKPESRVQSAWLAPGIERAPREPGMDASQRAVIRRWRQSLAENITVDEEMLHDMLEAGLLPEDVIKMIKVERMNKARVYRVVDTVRASEQTTAFDNFCRVLAKFYPDMAQNIIADVEIEKGHVTVDPALLHEAETLVHRRFGGNKRFCELDKKDIAELFAWKLHIAQGESRRERERLLEALRAEKAKNASATARCTAMADQLDTFTARHARRIVTHAHDMLTPGDVLASDVDSVGRLHEKLGKMLQRMDMVVTHDEKLAAERQQCLAYMKLAPADGSGPDTTDAIRLDTALSRYVTSALGQLEAEINDKEAAIALLMQQLKDSSKSSSSSPVNVSK